MSPAERLQERAFGRLVQLIDDAPEYSAELREKDGQLRLVVHMGAWIALVSPVADRQAAGRELRQWVNRTSVAHRDAV